MRILLSALALLSVLTAAPAARADEPAIRCPCLCAENYLYRIIRVTPSSVGLPPETDRFELFYHVEQACRNFCQRTTGRPDSYSRACI